MSTPNRPQPFLSESYVHIVAGKHPETIAKVVFSNVKIRNALVSMVAEMVDNECSALC